MIPQATPSTIKPPPPGEQIPKTIRQEHFLVTLGGGYGKIT